MIHVISGHRREAFAPDIDAMHRLRARVFHDRLGWDVQVENGREVDDFDRLDPTYMIARDDETGQFTGCLRLLPTTGPTMLREVFGMLLPDGDVENPTIWECSRFALEVEETQTRQGIVSRTTSSLLCAMVELGLEVGLTEIVAVYDARMARIFRAADCPGQSIGVSRRIGTVMAHAALFDITPAMWTRLARAGGIEAPVIASIDGRPQGARHVAA